MNALETCADYIEQRILDENLRAWAKDLRDALRRHEESKRLLREEIAFQRKRAEQAEAERDRWAERFSLAIADGEKSEEAAQKAEAEVRRLRKSLADVLSYFGDVETWRELTPEGAEHVRSCPMIKTPKVADLYRWTLAATRPTEESR